MQLSNFKLANNAIVVYEYVKSSNEYSIDMTSTTTTTYTLTANNYQDGIPIDATDVFISDDLDQSYYKEVFVVRDGFNRRGNRIRQDNLKTVNVTLAESITKIKEDAFHDCNLIKSITLPANLTRIGNKAFHYCTNLGGC